MLLFTLQQSSLLSNLQKSIINIRKFINFNSNILDMNTKTKQSIKTIHTKILVMKFVNALLTKIFVLIVLMLCLILVFISVMFELIFKNW
jgi:hypothetical protein